MHFYLFLGLLTLGQPTTKPAGPTSFQDFKASCIQSGSRHKSVSGNMRITMEAMAGKKKTFTEIRGAYEHLNGARGLLVRGEFTSTVTQEIGGVPYSDTTKVLTISDGRFAYTLSELQGQPPNATRNIQVPSQTALADEPFLNGLSQAFDIRVLPDELVDNKPVWVLEAKPKNPARALITKTIYYIAKDSGLRIRSTGHDATGKRVQLTELTDIKLDPPLKPERFVFKAPPGVRVVDLSPSK